MWCWGLRCVKVVVRWLVVYILGMMVREGGWGCPGGGGGRFQGEWEKGGEERSGGCLNGPKVPESINCIT